MATPPTPTSFLDKLTNTVYLDYVLKFGGIVMFGIALFKGWAQVGIVTKFLLVSGPVAWFVGDKFNKVYK